MKIIFSRKGFDSKAGGCPSPILPDGQMLSLPIPDKQSPIAYKDIQWGSYNLGEIVVNLTKDKIPADHLAHLDPDINRTSLLRDNGWRPILGQVGAAQGHLRNQGVSPGDLFLFFGLFQEAIVDKGQVRLNSKFSAKHVIWGWLQVENSMAVDEIEPAQYRWAKYHPHFHRGSAKSNTVYFGKERLDFPGLEGKAIDGGGVFPQFAPKRQLTASRAKLSIWKLPLWMFPAGKASALTYHGNPGRWNRQNDHVLLQTVSRGQEFVLDSADYPEAITWVRSLFIS
jgi:hypothetical protein